MSNLKKEKAVLMEAHMVKTIYEFTKYGKTKDIKKTMHEMLYDTFASQKKNGNMELSYTLNMLYNFKILCNLLDQIQEYEDTIYPPMF
ncbi:hypothetical protein [Tenacibaculum maritimum]|uniref:Uncharacterized protein n=2 Tax=Tenacibaculum maritimum TaxID=107401 RepID=A0A2H1E8B0_9FLAO|nr:hypothetical protein [Tenacibaculum maritimum]MCD9564031.1 hypothetical protein [Tenacibaculum maritimum]MCD9564392.1 hypothetical protein [Tenacibaculum maritimum]MCD9578256.1 hypothetical protein [Tenacibaculum maritimum]MCD9582096.1 hypothetical protein [Tenacibaculum maritimum]MCD9584485.1 hypothetical protein [Tenacibaculum maritimum]